MAGAIEMGDTSLVRSYMLKVQVWKSSMFLGSSFPKAERAWQFSCQGLQKLDAYDQG
jgi:hypothetical protein